MKLATPRLTPYIPTRPTVKQSAFLLLNCRDAFFGGAAGGGKALRNDQRIATPAGWVTHGAVQVGQRVLNPDGTTGQVIGVWSHPHRETFRITLDNGVEVIADAAHQWVYGETEFPGSLDTLPRCTTLELLNKHTAGAVLTLPQVQPRDGSISYRHIETVAYTGRADCTCITVDHPNRLYLTNDWVVTHNSESLLQAALQYVDVPGYAAIILRRTFRDLNQPESIMFRSKEWLLNTDAHWNANDKRWTFPSGATLTFGYLEKANDHYQYQGAEFHFVWPSTLR